MKESKNEVFFMVINNMLKQAIEKKQASETETHETIRKNEELTKIHERLISQFEKLKELQLEKKQELQIKTEEMERMKMKFKAEFTQLPKEEVAVQTLVDCKNVPFTVAAEKILEAKLACKLKPIASIIIKVEEEKIDDVPMPKETVVDFMHSSYVKKAEDIANKDHTITNFEDILYSVLEQRFIFRKKVKRKCQQFLIGLKHYGETDERMDDFKKFIGFDQTSKYPPEVLELYIKTMKSTDESFTVLLSDEAESLSLSLGNAHNKIMNVFNNASELMKQEILISLIYESNFYCEGKIQALNKENQRIRKFMLAKVRNGENEFIDIFKIEKILPEIIKEDLIEGTLQNYAYKDSKNFLRQKLEIRIPIRKYMSIGLKTAIRFYETAKNFYMKLYKS